MVPGLIKTLCDEPKHASHLLAPQVSNFSTLFSHVGRQCATNEAKDTSRILRALCERATFTEVVNADDLFPYAVEGCTYYTFPLADLFNDATALPVSFRTLGNYLDKGCDPADLTWNSRIQPHITTSDYWSECEPVDTGYAGVDGEGILVFLNAGVPNPVQQEAGVGDPRWFDSHTGTLETVRYPGNICIPANTLLRVKWNATTFIDRPGEWADNLIGQLHGTISTS